MLNIFIHSSYNIYVLKKIQIFSKLIRKRYRANFKTFPTLVNKKKVMTEWQHTLHENIKRLIMHRKHSNIYYNNIMREIMNKC